MTNNQRQLKDNTCELGDDCAEITHKMDYETWSAYVSEMADAKKKGSLGVPSSDLCRDCHKKKEFPYWTCYDCYCRRAARREVGF